MLVATWNVNSIRARLERLLLWLEKRRPDVVCLQEVKTPEARFPFAEMERAGYRAAVFGQKGYHGVAILARSELQDVSTGLEVGATTVRRACWPLPSPVSASFPPTRRTAVPRRPKSTPTNWRG